MNAASPAGPATLRQPTSWSALVDRAGRRYPGDRPRWCGDDSSPLTVAQRPGITRAGINPGIPSRWRYADALGIPGLKPVALGEARTPLLSRRLVGLDVAVKMETQNSTGSFKDRGSSVRLSVLRAQVVTPVLEDSSGNGGLSVAAYCAAAGIHAKILAPATSSPAKLSQSRFHGAEVELRPGTRQGTADEAR